MRWPAFLALAYLAVGVQVGIGGAVVVGGVGPNLVLLVVVFAALNAPVTTAAFAGVTAGLMQDLATAQPLGLFALAYGMTGYVVARSADLVRRGHPLTHVAMVAVGGAITAGLTVAHGLLHRPGVGIGTASRSALYTAVLGPFVIGLLGPVRPAFGFAPVRRRR